MMRAQRVLVVTSCMLAAAACGGPGGDQDEQQPMLEMGGSDAAAQAFRNAVGSPPAGWTGPVFELSHDYPQQKPAPPAGGFPWQQYDFKTQPDAYIRSLLEYARTDLEAVDWQPTKLAQPNWFHAPWMAMGDTSGNGREYIHGMTQERSSRTGELSPQQKTNYIQNYAVGLYNDLGGWTFGQVWADPGNPDASKARFPDGTMGIKLLFTEADPTVPDDGVPFLKGSKEWLAAVAPYGSGDRQPKTLRLLQVDVAVRDTRNDDLIGWVFGTFVYDGNSPGDDPIDRLQPVGLAWGDDPGITPTMVQNGTKLTQTWINTGLGLYQHLGWAGRLNGPVDNPISSCLSCHGLAEQPLATSMVPPKGATEQTAVAWFENIPAGTAKDPGSVSLDYSLQMTSAFHGWSSWKSSGEALGAMAAPFPVERGTMRD